MTTISIPEFCLLLLVGPSGSGKSTLARKHFAPTEILSSDAFRAMVADDEEANDASADAFAALQMVAASRLRRRLLTVIDATNLQPDGRAKMVEIARNAYAPAVAVVLEISERTCLARNKTRDLKRPRHVVKRHVDQARGVLKSARREGFAHVHRIAEGEENDVVFLRERLWTDARHQVGPFDIIGDVHGCLNELLNLLARLDYQVTEMVDGADRHFGITHPDGRRLLFVGDFVDRGPDSPGVLSLVMSACEAGVAFAVKGNHDVKLMRHLRGQTVSVTHGFDLTLAQLDSWSDEFKAKAKRFIDGLTSHLWLDGGALAIAHAGVKEEMQGKAGKLVSDFCTFGETTGETDEFGIPVRANWAASYKGKTVVAYGHVPTTEAVWVGNTICLDTGCVFGGRLSALRWPEREIVSIPAERTWFEPIRPVQEPVLPVEHVLQLPDAAALTGRGLIQSRFGRDVSVAPGQSAAAFEALVRFGYDPRWLVYVPPTTATVEASARPEWLEHPDEAFAHYAAAGIDTVCVQEKHMGSRAVVVACRDQDAAYRRFRDPGKLGAVMSKNGRPFFTDFEDEVFIIDSVREAMTASGLWDEIQTDWIVLDGEMLPWNAKAGNLIRDTFAATGAAARAKSAAGCQVFAKAAARGVDGAHEMAWRFTERAAAVDAYRKAYQAFVLPYEGRQDLRFAPFHVMAAENQIFADQEHSWHMEFVSKLAMASHVVIPTIWMQVSTRSDDDRSAATSWWEQMTSQGAEGFIVKGGGLKPGQGGLAPSIKVRGRDYLRIIYGPEYDRPEILSGLKKRATSRKRTLARMGSVVGLESLARFVEGASMSRVHECIAASLALGMEPLDTRL